MQPYQSYRAVFFTFYGGERPCRQKNKKEEREQKRAKEGKKSKRDLKNKIDIKTEYTFESDIKTEECKEGKIKQH
jgi:hypothetical protein